MQGKIISAGVGVLGFGALVGWAVTADHFERKMKSNQRLLGDIIDRQAQQISDLKEFQIKNYSPAKTSIEVYNETKDLIADSTEPEDRDMAEDDNLPDEIIELDNEVKRVELQRLISQYQSDPDARDIFVDKASRTIDRNYQPPAVISRQKYSYDPDEGDDYAKITLTYYPHLDILLDDDDERVDNDDVDALIGLASLRQFGGESEDPNVVFVRNRMLSTDFEVVKDDENDPPLHVKYGMPQAEFEVERASGALRLRPEDQ